MTIKLATISGFAVFVTACATFPQRSTNQNIETDQQLIERAWPYAQLAYNAYHRERIDTDAKPFSAPEGFTYDNSFLYENDETGLAFETAERTAPIKELIFVFRGTEGNPGRKNCDWKRGNFRLHQQRRAVLLVNRYLNEHPLGDRRLVFVGHSLGGSIATQLTFEYPDSRSYIFNSSPQFVRKPAASDDWLRRLSIVNRFEFLYFGRTPKPEAHQIYLPMNCGGGLSPVSRHSMLLLATCLTRKAAKPALEGNSEASINSRLAAASVARDWQQFSALRLAIDPTNATQLCPAERPVREN